MKKNFLITSLLLLSCFVALQAQNKKGNKNSMASEQTQVTTPPPAPEPTTAPKPEPEPVEVDNNPIYNSNSVRPINYADIMYQKGVWRRIDLREPQNQPFQATNRELSRIIIEALKANKIKAYKTDSLNRVMKTDDVMKTFSYQESVITESGEDSVANREYGFSEVVVIDLRENRIFDRKRSLMYNDIQALSLVIPAEFDKSGKGFDIPVASFKYKELAKLFKEDPRAKWFNTQNDAEHKNYADAFELRLFSAFILKVSNPNDASIADIYSDKGDLMGIMASHWMANELMEYEHNLWEF